MDDYTRDLEEEVARYTLPNPFHQKRTWRLLFISSDGRVRQSGNYRVVITTTLVILCLLLAALAGTTGLWFHTKQRLADALARQARMSATLNRQTSDQERLMARLALAEEKLPPEAVRSPEPTPPPEAPPLPKPPKALPDKLPPFVRVDTLEAVRAKDEKTLNITFKLHNDTADNRRIKGHIFLVFPPKDGSGKAARCLPAALMKNGMPTHPEDGESFQIRNFNTNKFRLKTDAGELPHTKVILYVFDAKGALRYEKEFPI